MTKYFISSFLLALICLEMAAQEQIDTDRPDQTESAVLVPKNYLQGEFGFNKENFNRDIYSFVYPTSLLKYGLGNKFELRLETNMIANYENYIPQTKTTKGFEPIEIGFKAALWEEQNARPKTSIIMHFGLPTVASKNFKAHHLAPSFRFTMQNSLTENLALGYNVGAAWDGFSGTPSWLYTFAPGLNIGKRWYGYIEAFGFIQQNELPEHNADIGIAYYISNNVKADLSGGIGISKAAPDNYFAIGFSFRVNTKKKQAD